MSEKEIFSLIIIGLIIPVIIGIIDGLKNKIVVFRNYDDLWLVFLTILLPFIFVFAYAALESNTVIIAGCIAEVLLLGKIIHRTYEDNNKNISLTILALYTKLPLSTLFIFQVISYLSNLSKPFYKRTTSLTNLISIICLTPLIMRLVKNKNGLFN